MKLETWQITEKRSKVLEGKCDRCRRNDNSKIDLKETEWESVEWIHLAEDRNHLWGFVNTVVRCWDPLTAKNFTKTRVPGSVWTDTPLTGICLSSQLYGTISKVRLRPQTEPS
jgi:hypothetical protein